jgi:glycosyltransferase involved in cell wall biosynthesis
MGSVDRRVSFDTTAIIPIYNLKRAGRDDRRLKWVLMSLSQQMRVIVVDGSRYAVHREHISKAQANFDRVEWISHAQEEFNLCELHNIAIREVRTEWVQITGVDLIFHPGYLDYVKKFRAPDRYIMSEVLMCPRQGVTQDKILNGTLIKGPKNPFGKLANGTVYAHRDFFLANPYPEEMKALGAQDNLMYYVAKNAGLEVGWLPETLVYHLAHQISTFKRTPSFEVNQRILEDYIKKHGLKPDLRESKELTYAKA